MLFESPGITVDEVQPWSVCTSRKWAKADYEATKELYAKYGRPRVFEVLQEYASAQGGGAVLPPLKNPRSLLFGWAEIVRELARCVEPSFEAVNIAVAEGRPTLARAIELSLRARRQWVAAAVAFTLGVTRTGRCFINTKSSLPVGSLVVSLADHYVAIMPPPEDYVCGWVRRTDEPWHHRHPWHMMDGYQTALQYCGNGDIWLGLVVHVERYLAG